MAWQGDPRGVVYENLLKHSPTFSQFQTNWESGWRQEFPRASSHSMAEDIKLAWTRAIIESGQVDLAFETLVQFYNGPPGSRGDVGGWNFFHLCALRRSPRLLQLVLDNIDLDAENPTLREHANTVAQANDIVIMRALGSVTATLGRNPLHMAAIARGYASHNEKSDCYDILKQFCYVFHVMRHPDGTTLPNPMIMKDVFGKLPEHYLAAPLGAARTDPKVERYQAGLRKGHLRISGGWPSPPTESPHLTYSKMRCDLKQIFAEGQLQEMELMELVQSGEPFIIRAPPGYNGTASQLAVPFESYLLRKDQFLRHFKGAVTNVDSVPYGAAHRSVFSGQNDLKSYSDRQEEVTIGEFVNRIGEAVTANDTSAQCGVQDPECTTNVNTSALKYMFSSNFVNEYPAIRKVSVAAKAYLNSLPSVRRVNDLQLFLGPAGSGAPFHWHPPAVNFLAFGEKRWYLIPPLGKGATYSNVPIREWLNDPYNRPLVDDPTAVLQCTQHPGDIVFVPDQWVHATLNTKPSIGVAHEVIFLDDDIEHPCSTTQPHQGHLTENGMCTSTWNAVSATIKSRGNRSAKVVEQSWQSHYGWVYGGYNVSKWRAQYPDFRDAVEQKRPSLSASSSPKRNAYRAYNKIKIRKN